MTWEEAIAAIHSTPKFSRKVGLHRMQALMERLGNPQDHLKFVHIAGTNGKGSTAAMTAAMVQAAGYRTGLFTSPYLQRFHERIRLNGQSIPDQDLADTAQQVLQAAAALEKAGAELPNEFELVTAIALVWYARRNAELVVLEVGLGGRGDATNIIPPPVACGITSISLDHTQVLGDTVEQIAAEKAGILKPGTICVLSPDQPEGVKQVVRQAAREKQVPLLESSRRQIQVLQQGREGLTFSWLGRDYRLPLLGDFQVDNLCTALNLIDCLRMKGFDIPDSAVGQGLKTLVWPGRLELLRQGRVLLDCCHNPEGIAALCRELEGDFSGVPVTLVMGMLEDKDYQAGLRLAAQHGVRFFAVSPPSPRALSTRQIVETAAQVCSQVTGCRSIEEALELALAQAEPEGLVVVCGSIPLVGSARDVLLQSGQ